MISLDRGVVDAQALQRAASEVDDEDVGVGQQLAQGGVALGAADVERDAALVAVGDLEDPVDAVADTVDQSAHGVALVGFDLDHVGAEFAEDAGAHGSEEPGGHLDDFESLEQRRGLGLIGWHGRSIRGLASALRD